MKSRRFVISTAGLGLLLGAQLLTGCIDASRDSGSSPAGETESALSRPEVVGLSVDPPREDFGITMHVVPNTISYPEASYRMSPEAEALQEKLLQPPVLKTKQLKRIGESQRGLQISRLGEGDASSSPTPDAVGTTFDSYALFNTGRIPADPIGAAGPDDLMNVVNSDFAIYDKTGTLASFSTLQAFFGSATSTFDPKVLYDQFEDRFVVTAVEAFFDAQQNVVSHVLVAVSDDPDPLGTWHLTTVNTLIPIGGENTFNDFPGIGLDEEAIYLTTNQFGTITGVFRDSRIHVIDKGSGSGGFYDGGAATTSTLIPPATGFNFTLQPAHVFGVHPGAVGTYFTSYNGLNIDPATFVQVHTLSNPLTAPSFTTEFPELGVVDDLSIATPPAPQQIPVPTDLEAGDRETLQGVWRNDFLYVTTTLPPVAGPDAGQATAHWVQIDTPIAPGIVFDQGNIGGEDIAAGTHTFYPSIAVNSDDVVGLGFSASGPNLHVGSYFTFREAADPPGTVMASQELRAGVDRYIQTGSGTRNRWGDYSGTVVDPTDDCFWAYNQNALEDSSPPDPIDNAGVWNTAWGQFCVSVDPFCGDNNVDPNETCDPPGDPAGQPDECRDNCLFCGDGTTQPADGEECDDGNNVDDDGCSANCIVEFCGDGTLHPGETCDPPGSNPGQPDECRGNCTYCGDGDQQAADGEECDDGGNSGGDGCSADCLVEVCGDSVVQPPETCDPPGSSPGQPNECRPDCGFCGDGVVGGTTNRLINGNFETGDFQGWNVDNQAGGLGTYGIDTPGSPTPLTAMASAPNPSGGSFHAVFDANGPTANGLSQSFTVPGNATNVTLTFEMYVNNWNSAAGGAPGPDFGTFVDPAGLDYTTPDPNQHVRVELLAPGFGPLETSPAAVIRTFYVGADTPLPPPVLPYAPYNFDITADVVPGAGYVVRFGGVLNRFFLTHGVDNVAITALPVPESCDDGNNLGNDSCTSYCRDCTAAAFDQTILATSKAEFGWPLPEDVAAVRGDLSLVGSYNVLAANSAAFATTLAAGETPTSGNGYYWVVRTDCAGSTWTSGGPSEVAGRDGGLP